MKRKLMTYIFIDCGSCWDLVFPQVCNFINLNFRAEQQNAASRREFDLYDPESKKKDQPARVSDDDPRCQVSGLQLFQG